MCLLPGRKRSSRSTSSSTSSRLSTKEIKGIVESLRHQQYRDSTKANYYRIWNIFAKFYLRLDCKPIAWDERLVLFVGYLVDNKLQSSTVKSYISAIKAVLKEDGIKLGDDQYLITSLTRACKLKNDQIKTRLPIRKGFLALLLRKMEETFRRANQPYLSLLFRAIFSACYFRLMRVSEVAAGGHQVLAKDFFMGENKRKMLFILRTSKTHWKNMKPQLIKISSTPNNKIKLTKAQKIKAARKLTPPCPYELLDRYSKARGGYYRENEPFFVFADHTPVTPHHVRSCLKRTICDAGFDESLYGTHSVRIGRSCDLYDLGLSVETIKRIGRWKSNAVFRYLRT